MHAPAARNPRVIARSIACAVLVGFAHASPAADAPARHVVVITVDGLRPDALAAAPATNIQRLAKSGGHGTARAVEIPETLPSHLTLASGLPPSVHGVTFNDDRGASFGRDTLFTQVHEDGWPTALYYGKSKLVMLAPRDSADVLYGPGPKNADGERGRIEAVAGRFARDFPKHGFRLAWVHLREPDWEGHNHGWMSDAYLAALREADRQVGVVLEAIEGSRYAARTAVILTSDHGGDGDSHGAHRPETSWRVPFMCKVPGAGSAQLGDGMTLADLAPTVLAILGLPPLAGATGTVIRGCLPR